MSAEEALRASLLRARALGFLGPGPIDAHLQHATGFAAATEAHLGRPPRSYLDLGSGGGVPGLILATHWPCARGALVESAHRRAVHLRGELELLVLDARIEVVEERAEVTGRRPGYREQFEIVTARSFSGPAVTAELASPLITPGGAVIVSEPPTDDETRWPPEQLASLGLAPAEPLTLQNADFVRIPKVEAVSDAVPRRVGRPSKRPRW